MKMSEKSRRGVCEQRERTSFGSAQGAHEERPDGRGRWSAKRKTAAVLRILSGEEIMRLRHDHGSQYTSDDFRAEIAFLGMESSPAFVRQPEGNGCAGRFIRTLKEKLLWGRTFQTVEELRQALRNLVSGTPNV